MNLRPVDLPELRDETAANVTRDTNLFHRHVEGEHRFRRFGPKARADFAEHLAQEEATALAEADLFHVSADMAELAVAASRSLPDFNLMPEDVPTRRGFVYFATPVASVPGFDSNGSTCMSLPVVAASWTVEAPQKSMPDHWRWGAFTVHWYATKDGAQTDPEWEAVHGPITVDRLRKRMPGRLSLAHRTEGPFSPDPIPEITPDGEVLPFGTTPGLTGTMRVLKAAWLLMAQPVATVGDAQFDRATRRRLRKEPPAVRVITLRRPAGSGNGESDREYHHQWIVRGHWRQQWYPARQVHRPVWIAPHVKGPEGAPLLGGEKVYAWSR